MTSQDAGTEAQFRALFGNSEIEVVRPDRTSFSGLVVGFFSGGRVIVMDAVGELHVASIYQLRAVQKSPEPKPDQKQQPTVAPSVPKSSDGSMLKVLLNQIDSLAHTKCLCGCPRRPGQADCLKCHREKQRGYREKERSRW